MSLTLPAINNFISKAADLVKNGNYSEALKIFELVKIKASDKIKTPDFTTTIPESDQPDFVFSVARCLSNMIHCHLQLKQPEKALECATELTTRFPDYAKGHARRASTLETLKRYQEASNSYKQAATVSDRRNAELPETYEKLAAECEKLHNQGRGIVEEHQNSSYYVEKYQKEANALAVKNQFSEAAELFAKAIKHERKRVEEVEKSGSETDKNALKNQFPPTLSLLLVNRAAMLCRVANNIEAGASKMESEKKSSALQLALDDTKEALVVSENLYARAHGRLITILIAMDKLRSARTAFDEARNIFFGQSGTGNNNNNKKFTLTESMKESAKKILLQDAEQDLIKAENAAQEKIDAAEKELQRQRQEIEDAKNARNMVGDTVGVDGLKRRKVEETNTSSAASKTVSFAAGVIGGGSVGSSEYCKFCSRQGHNAGNCPIRQEMKIQEEQARQQRKANLMNHQQ